MPTVDLGEYRDKLALLEGKIKINIQRIESKIKEPTSIVALEDILDDKFLCDWKRAAKHLPDVVKIYPLMPTMKLHQRVDVLKSLV